MTPTEEQEAAIEMASEVARRGTIGILSGNAGCGKTETTKWILERVGRSRLLAPTARGAKQTRSVTGAEAGTCHSWLYFVDEDVSGRVTFVRRPLSGEDWGLHAPPSNLIIVDEASMLGRDLFGDVWGAAQELGCGLLLVGDGFQLPPVVAPGEERFSVFSEDFAARASRTVTLDRVFRQALESLVLRVATGLRTTAWGGVEAVLNQLPAVDDVVEWSAWTHRREIDRVTVTHRNITRLTVNKRTRAALGIDPAGWPEVGEPVLVRRNTRNAGIWNGEVFPFGGWLLPPDRIPMLPLVGEAGVGLAEFGPSAARVLIDPEELLGSEPSRDRYTVANLERKHGAQWLRAQYGYALTCHAVQGGQFDEVAVVLENSLRVMPEEERLRWLYTAVSRAKTSAFVASPPVPQ